MKLGTGIRAALLVVGLLPVAVAGWIAHRVTREEMGAALGDAQARQAASLARAFEERTLDRLESLRLAAGYIPFDRLSPGEVEQALAIPLRQAPDLGLLALLDAEGRAVAPPASAGLASDEDLEALSRSVPLEAALQAGMAVGPPYRAPSSGSPRVALAVRTPARVPQVLVAELSLEPLAGWLEAAAGQGTARLLDGGGRLLAEAGAGGLGEAPAAAGREGGASFTMAGADGGPWLASAAPVAGLGWRVLVAQPEALAFRAATRARQATLYWAAVAAALALALGVYFARALTRPVERLLQAAADLTAGRYDAPLPEAGGDELGALSGAFGHMAREVRRRDEEIRAWNAELAARVEARTRELTEAEAQLARSARLTALGSLAAGVARGLNDPLTSVIGLVGLAREEVGPGSPAGERLATALREARRAAKAVKGLRHLAAPGSLEGLRRFQLTEPVRHVLARAAPALAEQGIVAAARLPEDLPPVEGDAAQLETVFERLVENAMAAMDRGGRLEVAVAAVQDGALRATVRDTGRGIPAAIRDRIFDPYFTTGGEAGAGLGLTVAHGIVQAHHGRLLVESQEGRGATFTVILPAAAPPGVA